MYEAKFAGVSSPLTASSPLDLHLNSSQSPLCNDIESSETSPSMMSATIRLGAIRWPSFANSSDSRMLAFACLLSTVHTVRTLCLYGIFSHYFDILPEKVLQCRLQYMQWCFCWCKRERKVKRLHRFVSTVSSRSFPPSFLSIVYRDLSHTQPLWCLEFCFFSVFRFRSLLLSYFQVLYSFLLYANRGSHF